MTAKNTVAEVLNKLLVVGITDSGKEIYYNSFAEIERKAFAFLVKSLMCHLLFFFNLDPDIRYCVLMSLDERFDPHLAQAENLAALFVALNDEIFEIRELAICTIGRLSSKNPAYVMPSLRKTLIQVLDQIQLFSKLCALT